MTASAQQLVTYLNSRFWDWPRSPTPAWLPRIDTWPSPDRPSADQLATALLHDAEFVALGLGGWMGSDQGRIVTEALQLVSPPFLRADERLLQEALTLAAQQQAKGNRNAGLIAVGAIGVTAALAVYGIRGGSTRA